VNLAPGTAPSLPADSPDRDAIEMAFANRKAHLSRLLRATATALDTFTPTHLSGLPSPCPKRVSLEYLPKVVSLCRKGQPRIWKAGKQEPKPLPAFLLSRFGNCFWPSL
jgi:hypothetical protein